MRDSRIRAGLVAVATCALMANAVNAQAATDEQQSDSGGGEQGGLTSITQVDAPEAAADINAPSDDQLPNGETAESADLPPATAVSGDPQDTSGPAQRGDETPIANIQALGAGDDSALINKVVTTSGVVTALYPTAEATLASTLDGFTIQTPGTGGTWASDRTASDGLFVYVGKKQLTWPSVGECVKVTGKVSEYPATTGSAPAQNRSLTQLSVTEITPIVDCAPVTPTPLSAVPTPDQLEALESMLIAPEGTWTITDNYQTNQYGTLAITPGTEPLYAATDKVAPGDPARAYEAENAAKVINLDDGTNTNLSRGAATGVPYAYLANGSPSRVGYHLTFAKPVVVDSRHGAFVFQPTQMVAGHPDRSPVAIAGERPAAPVVDADVTVATFNVLNYFVDLGQDEPGCDGYVDRLGNKVTAKNCKVRGAWSTQAFENQQTKIVQAINTINADLVALEEIENPVAVGVDTDRDKALKALVAALNAQAGTAKWTHVPSPATLPANEDVIRTAYIYQAAKVAPVGESIILDDAAFTGLARQPLAQEFAPVVTADQEGTNFVVIANHFKSKGSVPTGMEAGNTDTGDGQGNSNAIRVAQARALATFAEQFNGKPTLLVGDFNAYSKEDPLTVLTDAGWQHKSNGTHASYVYSGRSGSLDHVFANAQAAPLVTEVASWPVNAQEAVAFEYSRANYSAALAFEADNPYRSSDHNPEIVGLDVIKDKAPQPKVVTLDLYNLTDIHGHIEQVQKKGKVVEAGLPAVGCYLEKARVDNPNSSFTLLGDNIGASPYTSGALKDNPTIAALNTLKPLGSTIGNHELDMGQAVFKQRVDGSNPGEFVQAQFPYLGANVEGMGTWGAGTPYLGEYVLWTSPSGVKVAFIGAIAQDVPYKLSPGTTEGLTFHEPIAKIDSLAKALKENGTADVVVAMLDDDVKNNFPKVGANVDVIMGGDTHVPYEFDAVNSVEKLNSANPLLAGIASGSYTDNLGLVRMTFDTETKKVLSADSILIPAAEVATCGTLPETQAVVDEAIAQSQEAGKRVVANGYTQAFRRGVYTDPAGDTAPGSNRGVESSLGDLVADAMREMVLTTDGKPVDIGIINAGGLREDLVPNADGTITYAQTYAVMPFSNELGYVTITGADFKDALEQQWKTNLNSQNSRPLLKLGISDNVRYTYDPSAPHGQRITSVTVNGQPLDLARKYTIGSVTFLLDGGDSFEALTRAGAAVTSGNLDRDKFNDYLGAHSNVAPRAVKSSVGVTLPAQPVKDGESVSIDLRGLSFTEGPSITRRVKVSVGGNSVEADVDNSLLEEHASDEASIITTDGAGRAKVTVTTSAKTQCVGKAEGDVVSVPVVIESDFATLVSQDQGLSIQVTCPKVGTSNDPGGANQGSTTSQSTAITPAGSHAKGKSGLARTGTEVAPLMLLSVMLLGGGIAVRRMRKCQRMADGTVA